MIPRHFPWYVFMMSRNAQGNVRILKKLRRTVLCLTLAACGAACASAPTVGAVPSPFPGAVPSSAAPTLAAGTTARATAILDTAMDQRGVRYRLGGADPDKGFDCSGLVWFVFAQHQVDLPRTVAAQFHEGRKIGRTSIRAGDLVFFSTIGPGATHVGIALDADRFIHAPDTGAVVRIENIDAPYWKRRYVAAKRVF
jgi:cell wall-associated NlpC family hydrolase